MYRQDIPAVRNKVIGKVNIARHMGDFTAVSPRIKDNQKPLQYASAMNGRNPSRKWQRSARRLRTSSKIASRLKLELGQRFR